MERIKALAKSKTVWGALFGAGAWIISQPHVGVIEVLQAGGTVLTAIGLRDSVTKTINAIAPETKE